MAYADLKSMAKAALARGQKAVEAAQKTAQAERQQSSDARAATVGISEAKRRKVEARKATNNDVFTLRHTVCKAIPIKTLTAELKLQAEDVLDLKFPFILRVTPAFLEKELLKTEMDAIWADFCNSVARATTGRATRSIAEVSLSPKVVQRSSTFWPRDK